MGKKRIMSSIIIIMMIAAVMMPQTGVYAAKKPEYWLKVNTQANVVNVYKKTNGEWKPFRVMLCSTGINGTPLGTYKIKNRWDWGALVDNVYGRYCVHIFGDYLFHSVPYKKNGDKKSMPTREFNKLGKDASHGCVRLSIMDAKWVYQNCPKGTKVTIYKNVKPGPLGKPAGIKVKTTRKTYWDPTDNDPKNPYYLIKKPQITVSNTKKLNVAYGSTYKLKSGVTAKDPNTFQNLTHLVTVSKVKRFSQSKNAYVDAKFSTNRTGLYKVTYRVKYAYSGTSYKTIKIKVGHQLGTPVVTAGNSIIDGRPQLNWEPVNNADKYVVYRAKKENGIYTEICTTTDFIYTDSSEMEYGDGYYYKVKAVSDKNYYIDSMFSSKSYIKYDLPQPDILDDTN